MRPTAPALALALLLPALPGPAQATTTCEELWVTRNMLFHRAGYCFGSALGQALFGNAGCTQTDAGAVTVDRQAVDYMRGLEQSIGCRVNTGAGPTPAMQARKAALDRLIDIPVPDELGFACWGWRGGAFALHAGASATSPVIGTAQPRQSLIFNHWRRGDWSYVEVSDGPGTAVVAEGWAQTEVGRGMCDQEAG
jgi:hypothetical protein